MKTSPALRVQAILKRASDLPPAPDAAVAHWARVFGMKVEGTTLAPETEDSTLSLIADLRSELNEIERGGYEDQIARRIESIVSTARNATAVTTLNQPWTTVKSNFLRPETLEAWWWAAMLLPAQDDTVDETALNELEARLRELEGVAMGTGVPAELQRFVMTQARLLRSALRRYAVTGIGPLRAAVSQGLGDLLRDQEQVAEAVRKAPEESTTVVGAMREVYKKAVQVCGDADKLNKGYALMLQAYQKLTPVIEFVKSVAS